MDDSVDVLGLEQHVQSGPVPDVQLVKASFGVDGSPETGEQVVCHHHVPAGVNEFIYRVGANVTGAA